MPNIKGVKQGPLYIKSFKLGLIPLALHQKLHGIWRGKYHNSSQIACSFNNKTFLLFTYHIVVLF